MRIEHCIKISYISSKGESNMVTCYNCGKLLLDRKVMGLCEDRMHTFCSERCRSAAWSSDEKKVSSDSLGRSYCAIPANNEAKGLSSIFIDGAEYTYKAKVDGITIRIKKLENRSSWTTGKIRLELFLSTDGAYEKGSKVSGTTLAMSSSYGELKKSYSYTNMKTVAHLHEKPKSGTYTPILFVRELSPDGEWQIAGHVIFPASKWS